MPKVNLYRLSNKWKIESSKILCKIAKDKEITEGKAKQYIANKTNTSYSSVDRFFGGEIGLSKHIFSRICSQISLDPEKVSECCEDNQTEENITRSEISDDSTQDNKKNLLLASPHTENFRYVIEENIKNFVGRSFVFKEFKNFTDKNDRGYFTVVGDPGEGKSSIAAYYVANHYCPFYFNIRSDEQDTAEKFLKSICQQIIEFCSLEITLDPDYTKDGDFFKSLLNKASNKLLQQKKKFIIVIDALDEVDLNSQKPTPNILYLPKHLPPNTYFFLTRRRDKSLLSRMQFRTPEKTLDLLDYPDDTEQDVIDYIDYFLEKNVEYSSKLKKWIRTQRSLNEEGFKVLITEKSERNFMYLHHVLPQIADGLYQNLEITQLPQGLEKYYEDHWERMGMNARPRPKIKIDIIYILTEIRQPTSRQLIAKFASTESYRVKEFEVQEVLDNWEQFLRNLVIMGIKRYKVYHLSFNDFLHRQDIIEAAGVEISGIHGMIANTLFRNLPDEDEDEYN